MRLARGSHCFVWGSITALIYAGSANPKRDVNQLEINQLEINQLELGTGLAHAAVAPADPDRRTTLTSPDVKFALADPVARVDPDVQPEAADNCLEAEDCIDQYLWSIYERARKVDTIKIRFLTVWRGTAKLCWGCGGRPACLALRCASRASS
jgi:hypothetical protein